MYGDEGIAWYRIELQDRLAPQEPYFIIEVNPDGYGPFFPDKTYVLRENADGSLAIVSSAEELYDADEVVALGFDPRRDDQVLLIPEVLEAENGNRYAIRFRYKEGGKNEEEIFRRIIESIRLR